LGAVDRGSEARKRVHDKRRRATRMTRRSAQRAEAGGIHPACSIAIDTRSHRRLAG
jgi:hypothetical protein